MRQSYLAKYFNVPQCDVSIAAASMELRKDEQTREMIGEALSLLYEDRYDRMMKRATKWLEKKMAVELKLREYREKNKGGDAP